MKCRDSSCEEIKLVLAGEQGFLRISEKSGVWAEERFFHSVSAQSKSHLLSKSCRRNPTRWVAKMDKVSGFSNENLYWGSRQGLRKYNISVSRWGNIR